MKLTNKLGIIGNAAGVACGLHCMLIPVIISVLPAIGNNILCDWLEVTLLWTGIVFTLLSLCWGYSIHRNFSCFAFFVAALAWLLLVPHHFVYSLIGAGCLITSNIINHRSCKKCKCKCN